MMKSPLVMLFIFIGALLTTMPVAAQNTADCTPAGGEPVQVGAVFASGGLLLPQAGESGQGVQAMIEAWNACGGDDARRIALRYRTADSRDQAAAAAAELIAQGLPLIIGSGSPAVLDGLRAVTEAAGVVLWEVSDTLSDTLSDTSADTAWTFSPRPTNAQLGMAAVAFLEANTLLDAETRVALVVDDRPTGADVAAGVRRALRADLDISPALAATMGSDFTFSDFSRAVYAAEARALITTGLARDIDNLWFTLRRADANLNAFAIVAGQGFRRDLCARLGNTEGVITVTAEGAIDPDLRVRVAGAGLMRTYRDAYSARFNAPPTPRADLAASGAYLLARYVLPGAAGTSAEDLRAAILRVDQAAPAGLMGEGLAFDAATGTNQAASAVVQQRQQGQFCTLAPGDGMTCGAPLQPFPTWRARAVQTETLICTENDV